jgi:hypothetical protein
MSGKERNAFEKKLQKDHFSDDALKGFEQIGQEQAEKDIAGLMTRLGKRTGKRSRVIWYRVAASIAVLMIISSVFLIIERKRPEKPDSGIPAQIIPENKIQTPELPAVAENTRPKKGVPEQQNTAEKKVSEPSKREKAPAREKEPVVAAPEKGEAAMADEVQGPENQARAARLTKTEIGAKPSETRLLAKGKVISAEDNTPLAGVSVRVKGSNEETITDKAGNFDLKIGKSDTAMLVASFTGMKTKEFRAAQDSSVEVKLEPSTESPSDIVVVGHESANGPEKGYLPPQPLKGKAVFDKYIRDSLRRPVSLPTGQRVVVVLDLKVGSEGKIDSIAVIRSPSGIFSEEAIRLIRNGPDWKPGEINGKPINDEVIVRIVFM